MFLLYLLLYRLENKMPTAIQLTQDTIVVFNANGAVIYDQHARTRFDRQYWTLADSNAALAQPCTAFLMSEARLIQTSSPRPGRWKEWTKQKRGKLVVSDLPTPLEIGAIL